MNKFFLPFVFLFLVGVVYGEQGPGCDQTGAWNATAFNNLIDELRKITNELTRKTKLEEKMTNVVEGFTSNQTVTLITLWSNEILMRDIVVFLNPWILGLTCNGSYDIISTFRNELTRLEILKALVNLTIDLRQNNQTLLNAFVNTFNKRDAQKIIENASPRSCVWGDVTVKRLIFVVDTSGSMSTTFRNSIDGKTYTRLQYVASQLDSVIRYNLQSDQEFNVISFSTSPKAWSPGVVPVNSMNIDSAVSFVSALRPDGGTSMLAALKLAFQDPKALGIYLLTDGSPTDATPATILAACKQWSSKSSPPKPINAIAFLAGGTPDPNAASFMKQVAETTGGIYRAIQ